MSELTFAEPQRVNTPPAVAKETVSLERRETNPLEMTTLQQWRLDTLTGTFAEPRFNYDFSRVAAFTGLEQQKRPLLHTPVMVQRSPKNEDAGSAPCPYCPEADSTEILEPAETEAEIASSTETTGPMTEPSTPRSESAPATAPGSEPGSEAAAEETPASALIIEDSAEELGPGQMKKSDFLGRLRAEVSRTVDAAIAKTGRDTEGCPYLEHWFDFYNRQDSAHVERAIRRYAPETASVTTAHEYIPIIAERVRQAAEVWARTGEITGVPEGLPMGMPGMGLLGSVGRLFPGIGGIFFKARNGSTRRPDDPRAIQAELGKGQPLDSGVRSRMESAFGMDFAQVRAHTDTTASGLSTRMNARAFTVGEHVAFGADEFKPGTLVGDALIAHELAHVVQQGGGDAPSSTQMKGSDTNYNLLEDDADKSAVGVVVSLRGGAKGMVTDIPQNAIPRLRSGLRLQRCGAKQTPTAKPPAEIKNSCPSSVKLEDTKDLTEGGLKKGYRTAYGIVSIMHLLPDDSDWSDAKVYEKVSEVSKTCPKSWNLCTGTDEPFPIGKERYSTILGTLPAKKNIFYDFHTSRWNKSRLHDPEENPTGMDSCQVECKQQYVCKEKVLGNFTITRNFRKDKYEGRDVTRVDTTKT